MHSGHAEFSSRGVMVVCGFDAVVGVDSWVVLDVSCAAAGGLQSAQCHVVVVFEADLLSPRQDRCAAVSHVSQRIGLWSRRIVARHMAQGRDC